LVLDFHTSGCVFLVTTCRWARFLQRGAKLKFVLHEWSCGSEIKRARVVFRVGVHQCDGGSVPTSLVWCLDVYCRKSLVPGQRGGDEGAQRDVQMCFRCRVANYGQISMGMGENIIRT
jgi:hypothetical protein